MPRLIARARSLLLAVAIVVPLTSNDMERALALARRTDAERADFHKPYVVPVNGPPVNAWSVEQVEIVTEFRRLVLMAEEHRRLNDLWGRGGTRQVEQDMRPWQGRVSAVVHLRLGATLAWNPTVPPVQVAISGPPVATLDVRTTPLYGGCTEPLNCTLTGGLVEHVLDASSVGQARRSIAVTLDGRELASVVVDFARLD